MCVPLFTGVYYCGSGVNFAYKGTLYPPTSAAERLMSVFCIASSCKSGSDALFSPPKPYTPTKLHTSAKLHTTVPPWLLRVASLGRVACCPIASDFSVTRVTSRSLVQSSQSRQTSPWHRHLRFLTHYPLADLFITSLVPSTARLLYIAAGAKHSHASL